MKYKVGDWVVLSEHGAAGWPSRAGLRGRVIAAYPVGDCPYRVEYADIGQWYPFKEEEIELAPVFQGAPQIDFSQAEGEDGAWANETQRVLADDDKRENYPLYDGLFAYFPAALCEVARWSKIGGDKYHPGEPIHWVREKSTDHENKILRHLLDADKEMDDGFVEATALAWRALALCQSILEKRGWAEGANGRWQR